jgi:hypothetical protein
MVGLILMSCLTKILRPLHCSLIFQEHLVSRAAEKATSTFTYRNAGREW